MQKPGQHSEIVIDNTPHLERKTFVELTDTLTTFVGLVGHKLRVGHRLGTAATLGKHPGDWVSGAHMGFSEHID